jgi:hypothetical protein
MNPGDKAAIKGQLIGIGSMLGAVSAQATSGASLPIMTATGPAAAPGLLQMGAAINQHVQVTQEIVKLITKIVDGL